MNSGDFLTVMTQKMSQKYTKEEILKALKLFSDDETGKISFKNLKCVAKEIGENFTDEALQEMIDGVDGRSMSERPCISVHVSACAYSSQRYQKSLDWSYRPL
ncbi:hypothetical protein STEG23_034032 [Scotinomys teguina]